MQLHGTEAVGVIIVGVGVIDAKRLGVGQGQLVGVAVGAFVKTPVDTCDVTS